MGLAIIDLEAAIKQVNESPNICSDVKEDIVKILKALCGIEIKKETTYHIGQRFEESICGKCILAQVGHGMVTFIFLEGKEKGNRLRTAVEVDKVKAITEAEFKSIAGKYRLRLLEE